MAELADVKANVSYLRSILNATRDLVANIRTDEVDVRNLAVLNLEATAQHIEVIESGLAPEQAELPAAPTESQLSVIAQTLSSFGAALVELQRQQVALAELIVSLSAVVKSKIPSAAESVPASPAEPVDTAQEVLPLGDETPVTADQGAVAEQQN